MQPGSPASDYVGIVDLETLTSMSGLEFLNAMLRGDLPGPPIAKTLGFHMTEVEEGRTVFVSEPREEYYNPIRTVHAGYTATLLDSCMALRGALDVAQGHGLHDDGIQGFVAQADDEGHRPRSRRRDASGVRAARRDSGRAIDGSQRQADRARNDDVSDFSVLEASPAHLAEGKPPAHL